MEDITLNAMVSEPSNPNFKLDTKILQIVAKTRFRSDKVLIAGGSALDTLLGREYNDIDVWVPVGRYSVGGVSEFAEEVWGAFPPKAGARFFDIEFFDREYGTQDSTHRANIHIHCEHRTYVIQIMTNNNLYNFTRRFPDNVMNGFQSICNRVSLFEDKLGQVVFYGCLSTRYYSSNNSLLTFRQHASPEFIKKTVEKYHPYFGMDSFNINRTGILPARFFSAPMKLTKLTTKMYSNSGLYDRLEWSSGSNPRPSFIEQLASVAS